LRKKHFYNVFGMTRKKFGEVFSAQIKHTLDSWWLNPSTVLTFLLC